LDLDTVLAQPSAVHNPKPSESNHPPCAKRLVGTIRRECLDFLIPFGERYLRRILLEWVTHYNQGRPHKSLGPGIPEPISGTIPLATERHSLENNCIVRARAVLGGLHHEYRMEEVAA